MAERDPCRNKCQCIYSSYDSFCLSSNGGWVDLGRECLVAAGAGELNSSDTEYLFANDACSVCYVC